MSRPERATETPRPPRVQKVLASAGLGSRRSCEELIAQGRVTVDGATATLGDRADPRASVIEVDGERIATHPEGVHWMLNKPHGVVTTADDPEGRPTVLDFVPPTPRTFPVGRLDRDTEGLLLLTNDGELANRLAHPRYEVPKTYLARTRGVPARKALAQLTRGVELSDGPARATRAEVVGRSGDEALVEVTVTEGRNREVRRLLGAVSVHVTRLARIRLGPLALGDMKQGKHRPLTAAEVGALYAAVGLEEQRPSEEPT